MLEPWSFPCWHRRFTGLMTEDPLMRTSLNWIGMSVPALCLCGGADWSPARDPNKPTASPTEANPALPAPGHSVHGKAFNDGPRNHAYLMSGQGKIHFPVTTHKPEAQRFVDQGVAQLHSF